MEWTPVKSRNKSFDNLPGNQFEVVEFLDLLNVC